MPPSSWFLSFLRLKNLRNSCDLWLEFWLWQKKSRLLADFHAYESLYLCFAACGFGNFRQGLANRLCVVFYKGLIDKAVLIEELA